MKKIIVIIVLLGFMCILVAGVGAGGGKEESIYEEIEVLEIARLDVLIPYLFIVRLVPGAGIEAEDISNVKEVDLDSVLSPDESEIGSTFTGPSGVTYRLQEEKISEQEIEDMAQLGFVGSGVWVPISRCQ